MNQGALIAGIAARGCAAIRCCLGAEFGGLLVAKPGLLWARSWCPVIAKIHWPASGLLVLKVHLYW